MFRSGVWAVVLALLMGVTSVRVNADQASKIQEIVTPKGVRAWLIESHTLPMISVELSFRGGAMFEPEGKHGLANFTASLIDEGAGDYDAKSFKEELEAIGARLSADAGATDMDVNMTTLSEHKDRAFTLLQLAVNDPRFDEEAVTRMKDALTANIRRGDEDPATVAWRIFRPALFGKHPYANSGEGTVESVSALTREDGLAWKKKVFTKSNMVVSVVGDISPKELSRLLDKALGDLPEGQGRMEPGEPPVAPKGDVITRKMALPQGTVLMGLLGLPRDDPDYFAMQVMNDILGGGVLTSRLGADVREKHGLVYDVRSVNVPMKFNGIYYVSLATDNMKVEKALQLVRKHLKGITSKQVTQQEFDDAKAYLIGSFPLRMDSNAKLLAMLTLMQSEKLGKDYMDTWPKRIASVTREDILRVAQRLIQPEKMVLVVVGDGPALKAK